PRPITARLVLVEWSDDVRERGFLRLARRGGRRMDCLYRSHCACRHAGCESTDWCWGVARRAVLSKDSCVSESRDQSVETVSQRWVERLRARQTAAGSRLRLTFLRLLARFSC